MSPNQTSGDIKRPDWFPDWSGQSCAIIASGPSAKDAQVELLQGRMPVVVINTSYELAPWADVLYACDGRWWRLYNGAKDFNENGLKVSQDEGACHIYDLKRIIVDRASNDLVLNKPGYVGGGANSGFQVINLVVQFGVKRILLVGYDMRIDLGQHWHPRHPPPLSNPYNEIVVRWCRAIDGAAIQLRELGVSVINCSLVSALKNYPKMPLPQALEQMDAVCL